MIRDLIRRWLGVVQLPNENCAPEPHHSGGALLDSPAPKTTVQVVDATNGKVVVVHRHVYNPNGPDKHHHEIYIVPEGHDVGAAVIGAMTAAKFL